MHHDADAYLCQCECHQPGKVVLHDRVCCEQCPTCRKQIVLEHFDVHKAVCGDLAVLKKEAGICDTTSTPRMPCALNCGTYIGNLGPCERFEAGQNGRCVFCDHAEVCHGKADITALLDALNVAPSQGMSKAIDVAVARGETIMKLRAELNLYIGRPLTKSTLKEWTSILRVHLMALASLKPETEEEKHANAALWALNGIDKVLNEA